MVVAPLAADDDGQHRAFLAIARFRDTGDFALAIAAAREASASFPTAAAIWRLYASLANRLGLSAETQLALDNLERCDLLRPREQWWRANILLQHGFDAAAKEVLVALAQDEAARAELGVDLLRSLMLAQAAHDAHAAALQMTGLFANDPSFHYYTAIAADRAGLPVGQWLDHVERALTLTPDCPIYRINWVAALLRAARLDEAQACFEVWPVQQFSCATLARRYAQLAEQFGDSVRAKHARTWAQRLGSPIMPAERPLVGLPSAP